MNDVKVVTPAGDVMYPDVVVACGDLPGKATVVDAPVVIVEILSESTAERDHGRKRWAYQTIPSLRHYVLVDQDEGGVEVTSPNEDGTWQSVILRDLDDAPATDGAESGDRPRGGVYPGCFSQGAGRRRRPNASRNRTRRLTSRRRPPSCPPTLSNGSRRARWRFGRGRLMASLWRVLRPSSTRTDNR